MKGIIVLILSLVLFTQSFSQQLEIAKRENIRQHIYVACTERYMYDVFRYNLYSRPQGLRNEVDKLVQPNKRSDWAFTISNDEVILNSPATGFASVAIYDIRGRLVHNLHNGFLRSGRQNIGSLRLPVGSYVVVVRDSVGVELFREHFVFVDQNYEPIRMNR